MNPSTNTNIHSPLKPDRWRTNQPRLSIIDFLRESNPASDKLPKHLGEFSFEASVRTSYMGVIMRRAMWIGWSVIGILGLSLGSWAVADEAAKPAPPKVTAKLVHPWTKVQGLTPEQKDQILDIRRDIRTQIIMLEMQEKERCLAVLSDEQRLQLEKTLAEEEAARKAKDAVKKAERDTEKAKADADKSQADADKPEAPKAE
jgi:hypothetical protein